MSSEPSRLRFNRPLRNLRQGVAGDGPPQGQPPAPEEEARSAEQWQRLQVALHELARREEALARREGEVLQKERGVDDKLQELAALISSVKEEKAEMLEGNEEEIVSFSLSITEKVLQYEIENGRYKIGEVVKSTLRAVRDKGSLVVRVNPHDYELARAAVEKLAQTFGTTHVATVPDESIPLASCCIETDSGKIFSEIPGRLERIEKSLLKKNGDSDGV
jgi:flagellar biosynthesis/type III secretory pathway protein FliH